MKKVTVPFFISHQGCPNTCVFCDQRTISGSGGALPSSDEILAKIETWRGTAAGRPLEVAFFGGTFTALPDKVQDQLLRPLQKLLEQGEITTVRISTRPDCIDAATVNRLRGLGVSIIELGVQSMDDDVLERSGRGHDSATSETAIRCIKAGGLSAGAQLMPGLPGDSMAKSIDSLKRVIAAGADFIRLYPVIVLNGTELARSYESGEYTALTVEEGVQLCKVLLHEAMQAGVPVIRIGLQADDGLNRSTVLGGCWHPSLGRMTRSELYFDLLRSMMSYAPAGHEWTIRCHPTRVSEVTGQGKANLKRLWDLAESLQVKSDEDLDQAELVVENINLCMKGNIVSDLQYSII